MFLLRIRRGGFKNPSPWGEPSEYNTVEDAKKSVVNMAQMADSYNCVLDYQILNEKFDIIEQG